MAEVYYYVPNAAVENAVDCGLKLSEWCDGETEINGISKKYMLTLLNPKDNLKLYNSSEHTCLKLSVDNRHCYVADGCLRIIGARQPLVMSMYEKSMIPIEEYVFGRFRLPECLVFSTVIGGNIHVLNKRKDSPVLYDSSEELYVSNIIEAFRERNEDFNDTLLYSFYDLFAEQNEISKITDEESGLVVFIDKGGGQPVVLKKPPAGRRWFDAVSGG